MIGRNSAVSSASPPKTSIKIQPKRSTSDDSKTASRDPAAVRALSLRLEPGPQGHAQKNCLKSGPVGADSWGSASGQLYARRRVGAEAPSLLAGLIGDSGR